MTGVRREVFVRALAAVRKQSLWWLFGVVVFSLINVAFWPSLEGSDALTALEESGGDLFEAFGAAGIATPAGYLDGQVYALMLPLLLSGMALALATSLTAGDEDAGRLELLHALPVSRTTLWLGRLAGSAAALLLVTAVVTVVMVASLPVFSFEGVAVSRVVGATLACGVLGFFHAAVGYALAGAGASRALSLGGAVVVLVVGYVVAFVLPIADALEPAKRLSPWFWAIGTQPVTDGVSPAGLAVLVLVTAALVAAGTALVTRRDIRGA
jgi:ABC-2 type transport system permease protein